LKRARACFAPTRAAGSKHRRRVFVERFVIMPVTTYSHADQHLGEMQECITSSASFITAPTSPLPLSPHHPRLSLGVLVSHPVLAIMLDRRRGAGGGDALLLPTPVFRTLLLLRLRCALAGTELIFISGAGPSSVGAGPSSPTPCSLKSRSMPKSGPPAPCFFVRWRDQTKTPAPSCELGMTFAPPPVDTYVGDGTTQRGIPVSGCWHKNPCNLGCQLGHPTT